MMNLEAFIYKQQKFLRDEIERNVQVLASGGIDNIENYKYITGKIHALDAVSQEISNLLEEKEPKDNVRSLTKEV
jgi:hypothetical protein